ncbi:hypothetical protein [uncultured Cetobacterium sp.]|uniref:hypothetical protein n=1 Tax=uncultured Cetobacterium sp. TaxID=527638 RepID=UPI0026134DEA|nr:hypothetical protein [uncultured Cetobacterium sp.]
MSKETLDIKNDIAAFKDGQGIKTKIKNKSEIKKDELQVLQSEYGELELKGEINGEKIIKFRTNLTGQDMKICKARYEKEKKKSAKVLAELDDEYFLMMAERMTEIPYEDFFDLNIIDTYNVIRHVKNFIGE